MREQLKNAQTIVIKMGTSSLTHPNGTLDLRKIEKLTRILTDLENSGKRIILVSSGSIGCGMARLGLTKRPKTLKLKQVAASVGQGLLMEIYQKFFSEYHQNIAQILLTKDVFKHPVKAENARGTFEGLFSLSVIPIVNENDSISTDEIKEECFGDNDILSAMTARLVGADALLILSDVEGLYSTNPRKDPNAKLVPEVLKITEGIKKSAGSEGSSLGTGGMITKLHAAEYATKNGIDTVIASGDDVENIYDILEGMETGTIFLKKETGEKHD